jgi:uncharacterized protein
MPSWMPGCVGIGLRRIWGKYDPSLVVVEVAAYKRDLPNAEVHVLDAGHFATYKQPNEISHLIDDFVERTLKGMGTGKRSLRRCEMMDAERPPLPPFTTVQAAAQKVRMAEDAWNTREPERVALAYTVDSHWRNRTEFFEGRAAIVAFLTRKWNRELDYRLIKELWAFREDRIAVRFAYEWHDDSGNWFRSYGNELWEFNEHGLMRRRVASINDAPIRESDRKYHWPLGRRPDDHPSLSDLGL